MISPPLVGGDEGEGEPNPFTPTLTLTLPHQRGRGCSRERYILAFSLLEVHFIHYEKFILRTNQWLFASTIL